MDFEYTYKLVKLRDYSGEGANIYTVFLPDEKSTLFSRFINENIVENTEDLINISARLKSIGQLTGIDENYIKVHEGRYGDGVAALYDVPDKHLRLYCIVFSETLMVVGGGGIKDVAKWQDDPKLKLEAEWMIRVSKDVRERLRNGTIMIENNCFIGDLKF